MQPDVKPAAATSATPTISRTFRPTPADANGTRQCRSIALADEGRLLPVSPTCNPPLQPGTLSQEAGFASRCDKNPATTWPPASRANRTADRTPLQRQ